MPVPSKLAALAFTAVISASVFSNQPLAKEQSKMKPEESAVLNVITTMTNAFQKGDYDAVMGTYEKNASVAFEPGKPISDAAVIRQMFEGFGAMKPEFSYAGHEVIVEGDIAVHFAPWTMTGTGPDGSTVEQSGLSVAVLRKQADGSWRMVIDNPHGSRLIPQ